MAEDSPSTMVLLICDICDQLFSSDASLKEHQQNHIVSEPYKCGICQSTFSQPKQLKAHLSTHVACDKSDSEEIGNMSADENPEEVTAHSTERNEDEIMNSNVEEKTERMEDTSDVQVGTTVEGNDAPWSVLYPICNIQPSEFSKDSDNVETLEEATEDMYVPGTLVVPSEPHYRKLGKMQYQCLICNEIFTQVSHVKSHHVSHTGEKAYKCEDCGTMFTTPSSRRRHYSRFSHGQQYPDITKPRDQVNEEVLKIPAVRKVLESLASDEYLLKHQKRESKLLQIFRSNLKTSDVDENNSAQDIDSSVGTQLSTNAVAYDISKCGNCEIFGRTKCRIHGQIYKQLPYKCRLCMMYFRKYYEFQKHRLKHSFRAKHPYYRCGMCEAVFTKISKYVIHMRSHPLSRSIKPNDLKSIINHVMEKCSNEKFYRDDERPYKCFVCFKRFKTKTNLKGHYLTHQNLKPHICKTCGTAFTTPSSLNRHQFRFSHSGHIYKPDNLVKPKEKINVVSNYHRKTPRRIPFTCKHCNIQFHQKTKFQKHFIDVHSQFLCDICPKQFDNDTDLENHQLGHYSLVYAEDEWKLIPKNGTKMKSKYA